MVVSLFFVAAAIAVFVALGSSHAIGQRVRDNAFHPGKIAPWVVEHTANGQQAEFMVVLADQADLKAAATMRTKTEKGRYVHDTLRNKRQTTQSPILRWLRERGLEHRSFYIVNAVLVKGTREIAEALAARPDVARIEGDPQVHIDLPHRVSTAEAPSRPRIPETIEPGINYTHAPKFGTSVSLGKELLLGAPIAVFAGRITRLSLTTAAGTDKPPITITTGMTPFMTASAIRAGTTRLSLATTCSMAAGPLAWRSATTAAATRLGWRPAQNGSPVGLRRVPQLDYTGQMH